jgi:hypothetical protein
MDIWKLGIVDAPLAEVIASGLENRAIHWIEEPAAFAFLADPFGIERAGQLHVFAEAYDYRARLGRIDVLTFDRSLSLVDRRPCLREPWHLSYPIVIEDAGERWMLPEAYRSGQLTLYRASDFPYSWAPAVTIELPACAVDATPFQHDGLWWLLYASTPSPGRPASLHLAFAEQLRGPWRAHPSSPLSDDPRGSRPGGTPLVVNELLCAPMQDCSVTYGGAVRPLWFDRLTPNEVSWRLGEPIGPPASAGAFRDGLHTLSAVGTRTLIDVKRIERSWRRLPTDVLGRSRRAVRGWRARSRRRPPR